MTALAHAKDKLDSTIALLVELQSTDFPYGGPLEALRILEAILRDLRSDVEGAAQNGAEKAIVSSLIKRTTVQVATVLEFSGYILNSSNVRNIFEVHSPLLQIARQTIGHPKPVELILSFEWNYIPFTYPLNIPALPNFVVIGLPASEAFNALIIPAAGHELGHSAWRVGQYETFFSDKVTDKLIDLIQNHFWDQYKKVYPEASKDELDQQTWKLSYQWAIRQLQEIFCDIFGLALFGEAYLHAFKYLIAPAASSTRAETYPASRHRADFLARASNKLKIEAAKDYVDSFEDEGLVSDSHEYRLLLELADRCALELFEDLLAAATDYISKKKYDVPCRDRWTQISADFKTLVPTSKAPGFTEIINAGWEVYHDESFLSEDRPLDRRRLVMINELVLKSVEIFEIETRLSEAPRDKK